MLVFTPQVDLTVHLTNQCIQKQCDEYDADDEIECNMWSSEQFCAHLQEEKGEAAGRAAFDGVEAAMLRTVGLAMRAVGDVVEGRAATHELYGFDFMLDADHGVWLLEANSSPDMSRTAAPLRAIVDDGLDDLLQLVLDLKRARLPVAKLAAERQARAGPCWRIAYRGKALTARELQRRRLTKKFSMEAPGGNSSLFKGLSHAIALRPWLAVMGAAAKAAIEEPIRPNDM